MGEVILVYRILPKDMEHFQQIKQDAEKLEPDRLEEEPIAFGVKALKFTKIVDDGEGNVDKVEESLQAIENVENVETVTVSRGL